ncbi:FtsX-like permease family protein [Polymorphobacter fuscus]|uniref:FtsX-like permease family protein n=2 Tax=Sandarakinorhabdus fusca TaxID=1439888 RepID=A0A7C9GPY1_9SPHN|nr:ABC transporter permease [Polymorphobacter fuscus]MQT17857.1 FtsX-like permease family protein [Polymorphobacter fuscus]
MVTGEWRAHPGRAIIGALAIAVGVALGFAVHLVNRSALDSFASAVSTVNGAADLQVHAATPAGFDEGLYPRVARLPGVAAASPVVELAASAGGRERTVADRSGRITLLGLDVLRAVTVTPSLVGAPLGSVGAPRPFDPDALFVSRAALASLGAKVGDRTSLVAAGRQRHFTIAGLLSGAGDDQALAVIDIADAQWRFGQLGRLQRIDIKLKAGVDRGAAAAAIARVLPADAELVSAASEGQRSESLSRAYRVNLEMLAMVALLTGGFLVYSAQSLAVARRRSQFALLRVLGLQRRALVAQLVIEGALIGLVGALAGILLGYGLADLAVTRLGGDLGGGYFRGATAHLAFAPLAALAYTGLGIAVAVASSLVPARAAGRAQPAVALKAAGDLTDPRHRPRALPGVALIAAGGLAALGPPLWGLPLLGYAAMALILAGGIAVMPALARALLSPLQGASWPPAIDLAVRRLWGAPEQAAVALCGIVASTSLMVAMAVMVTSFRGSVDAWLTAVLPSDIYLHVEGAEAGGLDRAAQARLAATPGVARIAFVRQLPLRLAPDRPAVMLSAQPIDPADPGASMPLIGPGVAVPAGATAIWVSEPMGWLYGLKPGDRTSLPLGGAARPVFVAGVWRDYARQFGAIAIADTDFARLTGDASTSEAAVTLAPGADAAATIAALRRHLPPALAPQTLFAEPRQMRTMALAIFDRSFAVTYALEAIAIVIGLIGVAATFSAQTLARKREFGMLRHIGVRRRQIMAMLATEGAALGLVGVIAGLGLGLVMAQVLIHVVNPQSFHWTMDTQLPWGLFGALVMALVAAAAGTAVIAGRRALSADAVRAVRDDW